MAKTTDELFAEATEADYETAEPVTLAASDTEEEFQFRIDEHLRTIAIPEKGVVAGVEGDLNVNIARFTMTRYYHGRDLSKLNIRINYRNANGQVNYYTVSDATVSVDSIVFSWEFAADVTQYKGNVQFVVYLFSATNAVLKQRFFTTLGTLEVLEGLEVDSSIPVSEQTDILLHLKKDLSAYAEEVKKSLPADYTAMTEQVNSLKEDLETLNQGGLNLKDEVIGKNVTDWLDEHPEATTTVQDGAIIEQKINTNFLSWIKKDYVTPEMFGAIGDGVTDDSGAFDQAIKYLEKLVISEQMQTGYPYLYNHPLLILTQKYRITQIVINNNGIHMKGFDGAILCVDAIKARSEISIENITIIGLTEGIKFSVESDFNVPIIRNCTFYDCENTLEFNVLRSATVVIENCKFFNCDRILYNYADKCVMRNCFVEARRYTVPPIYNDGNLVVDTCIFVPATGIKMDTWIENHANSVKQGGLTLLNSRFGGENGGARSIIYNYADAITNPAVGDRNNIVIDKCQVTCAGTQGVLRLFAIPNRISITNIFGVFDCTKGLITTDDDIKLPALSRFIGGIVTDGSFVQSKSYPIVSDNLEYLYNNKYCETLKRYTADFEKRVVLSKNKSGTVCHITFDEEYTQGIYKVNITGLLVGTKNMYISNLYVRVNDQSAEILTEQVIFRSAYITNEMLYFDTEGNGRLICTNNSDYPINIEAKINVIVLYQGSKNGNSFSVME